jgi:hypothetical protein
MVSQHASSHRIFGTCLASSQVGLGSGPGAMVMLFVPAYY